MREDAFSALAHSVELSLRNSDRYDNQPRVVRHTRDHYSIIVDGLHDENSSVNSSALILLAKIAPWHCDDVSELVPTALDFLDSEQASLSVLLFLQEVALCNPELTTEITERLAALLDETDETEVNRLFKTLDSIGRIVDDYPKADLQVADRLNEHCLGTLTEHEHGAVRQKANELVGKIGR